MSDDRNQVNDNTDRICTLEEKMRQLEDRVSGLETTPPLNEAELEALDGVLGESEGVEGGCPCDRDCGARVPTKRKVKGVGK